MLLLHTVIFSLFKSLEAFNELNCAEVWIMFLTSRSVFFAFGAAKECFSANVLCGHSGFLQNMRQIQQTMERTYLPFTFFHLHLL